MQVLEWRKKIKEEVSSDYYDCHCFDVRFSLFLRQIILGERKTQICNKKIFEFKVDTRVQGRTFCLLLCKLLFSRERELCWKRGPEYSSDSISGIITCCWDKIRSLIFSIIREREDENLENPHTIHQYTAEKNFWEEKSMKILFGIFKCAVSCCLCCACSREGVGRKLRLEKVSSAPWSFFLNFLTLFVIMSIFVCVACRRAEWKFSQLFERKKRERTFSEDVRTKKPKGKVKSKKNIRHVSVKWYVEWEKMGKIKLVCSFVWIRMDNNSKAHDSSCEGFGCGATWDQPKNFFG